MNRDVADREEVEKLHLFSCLSSLTGRGAGIDFKGFLDQSPNPPGLKSSTKELGWSGTENGSGQRPEPTSDFCFAGAFS